MTTIAGRIMQQRITPRSLGRAQWFSDLLVALKEAEQLLALLEQDRSFPDETIRLKHRIQAVSAELELLDRLARGEGRVIGACWPEPVPARTAEA
jgi:hypothetical protein